MCDTPRKRLRSPRQLRGNRLKPPTVQVYIVLLIGLRMLHSLYEAQFSHPSNLYRTVGLGVSPIIAVALLATFIGVARWWCKRPKEYHPLDSLTG